MKYPCLVPKRLCKTDIHVHLESEDTDNHGHPDFPTLSGGTVTIFGEERRIEQGMKARNPDGTVNYCQLEVV